MDIIFYKNAYYKEQVYYSTSYYTEHRNSFNIEEKLKKMVPVESVRNNSKYYLMCTFYTGTWYAIPQYEIYCVAPNTDIPVILSNHIQLYSINIRKEAPKGSVCNNNFLKQITDDRRVELTTIIQNNYDTNFINAKEYQDLNEGHLVLYSDPYLKGTIKIIKDGRFSLINIEPIIKVYSFVNLTKQYFILSETKVNGDVLLIGENKTLNIYIKPEQVEYDITNKYANLGNMDIIRKVENEEFIKTKTNDENSLEYEPIQQSGQSDNVNIDTNPEQKKKQSTDTLPWYSIITIIIFIILILLCIVYRESLRSWSNLAMLDPRKFRDTFNPF